MSLQNSIRDALQANATLVAYFTGGILSLDDLDGIPALLNRGDAFDASGRVNPVLVVYPRQRLYTFAIADADQQARSFTQAVVVRMFADRTVDLATLETYADVVYGLLQDRAVGGATLQIRDDEQPQRTRVFGYARELQTTYDAVGVRTP